MKLVQVFPGDTGILEIGYSEVTMHLRVAGQKMRFKLLQHSVQLYKDGREYSFPILPSEAGLYWDNELRRYYTYPEKITIDQVKDECCTDPDCNSCFE